MVGTSNDINSTNGDYILYCWHDVPGLQKFGTFGGIIEDAFVELGFRPSLVL